MAEARGAVVGSASKSPARDITDRSASRGTPCCKATEIPVAMSPSSASSVDPKREPD